MTHVHVYHKDRVAGKSPNVLYYVFVCEGCTEVVYRKVVLQ